MIEGYFHTQLLLQEAFKELAKDGVVDPDDNKVKVFVSRPRSQGEKQWHLRPGLKPDVVAGREPEGGRPMGKPPLPDRSIGIEVFDAPESRNLHGTVLVYVSVNIAITGSRGEIWMDVKRYSNYVSRMGTYLRRHAAGHSGFSYFNNNCDIPPTKYNLTEDTDIQPTRIESLKPFGREEIYLDEETFNVTYARREFEMSLTFE